MSPVVRALLLVLLMPILADAALEKRVPCWPGFDFTIAPPYGDPQCQFNEANDCGFPPPPLSVQPTKQDADRYTEIVQNQTRSQVTGEAQRGGWQGTGQGSPSPCQASTKSTYNVKRVKQNQAAGKCVVSETNCKVTIIDSAPGSANPEDRNTISGDLESARRALLAQLESSVGREVTHGEALFAAQALNQLGYASDVSRVFDDAKQVLESDLDAASSLEGIAGGGVREARADAAVLASRLAAIDALRAIAFAPAELGSTGMGNVSVTAGEPVNGWDSFGRFAPGVQAAQSFFRGWTDSDQPALTGTNPREGLSMWQRFRAWAGSFFSW